MTVGPSDPHRTTIVGVGSALVDLCLEESDEFLASLNAPKGGMQLVEYPYIRDAINRSRKSPVRVPGGSACNTIVGIAQLGGKARFVGKRGDDEMGRILEEELIKAGVVPRLLTSQTPTGHVLSVITPDAQRSMFTFLGASSEAVASELEREAFADAGIVHIEGYLLFNHELIVAALSQAKAAGAAVSLDLASFTVVEANLDFLKAIAGEYVDILIANEDEARAFTGETDEQRALEKLARYAETAVLKLGKRGSCVMKDGVVSAVGPGGATTTAVDTTGAGDLWAAGFLYGMVHGYPIEQSLRLSAACGYEVCQVVGAQIPGEAWRRIRSVVSL